MFLHTHIACLSHLPYFHFKYFHPWILTSSLVHTTCPSPSAVLGVYHPTDLPVPPHLLPFTVQVSQLPGLTPQEQQWHSGDVGMLCRNQVSWRLNISAPVFLKNADANPVSCKTWITLETLLLTGTVCHADRIQTVYIVDLCGFYFM